jgi:4-amino-4-deoxy-L-arabinose transferase-like glycosyltransferase
MTPPPAAPPPARPRLFQRPWTWWFLVLALVLMAGVRLRLLNFPLERDEGEYAYAGQLMLQGIPPYQMAYNMKFPGTYAAYAVIMGIFGETPAGIHFGVLGLTTLTALMLFWLGRRMLDETAGMVAATTYAVLAASPAMLGLAGHATHFAAFFVTAGLCVLWPVRQSACGWTTLAAGLLFGLAILMKQHAALIGLWAVLALTADPLRQNRVSVSQRCRQAAILSGGLLLPFGLCCWILWQQGVFGKFWFWTVEYARHYESVVPADQAPRLFWDRLCRLMRNDPLLWLPVAAGLVLVWLDDRWRQARLWLLGFCLASALTVVPGFYFRKHYFLLALPAAALLAGSAVSGAAQLWGRRAKNPRRADWPVRVYIVMLLTAIAMNSGVWFIQPPAQIARRLYGADPLPEAGVIAQYLHDHSAPDARVAVLGSEPEIYFLSRRRSATGYIYTYGLMEPQPFASQMQAEMIREIESRSPEFVVFADNPLSWARKPDSDPGIFQWWNAYQTNYNLVGLADILSPTRTVYALGPEWVERYGKAIRGGGLEIYQRKPALSAP